MRINSTIKQRTGICPMCGHTRKQPLTAGYCSMHYWQSRRMISSQKAQQKELSQDEDLQTLVTDLDIIFSRYIRLKDAAILGQVCCYTCVNWGHWTQYDCGHFISRSHMYTRFSEMNCKPQCRICNRMADGNIENFAIHLEQERPGTVEQLHEQAKIIYKYSRDELKQMISAYSIKLKQVQKEVLT